MFSKLNLPSKTKNPLGSSCHNPLSFEKHHTLRHTKCVGLQPPDPSQMIFDTLKLPQLPKIYQLNNQFLVGYTNMGVKPDDFLSSKFH